MPSCFRLAKMWLRQVSLRSRCSPRYLTSSAWGSSTLFIWTGGQVSLRVVKVIWVDLVPLAFMRHVFSHFWIARSWPIARGFIWRDLLDRSSPQFNLWRGSLLGWHTVIQSGVSIFWKVVVVEKLAEDCCRLVMDSVRELRGREMSAIGCRYQKKKKNSEETADWEDVL
jgi:hypothetical protein